MKDRFSSHASEYSRFRPEYPDSLISFVLSVTKRRESAWDCGTGNGQLAARLSPHFRTVFATDISKEQLAQAPAISNVRYSVEAAGETQFADKQFDLISIAQAIHWMPFDALYRDVYRCLKDDGLFLVTGYGLLSINPQIDAVVRHLYTEILGAYWDPERRYIDEEYATIPFPFEEVESPPFLQQYDWSLAQFTGYLNTWSAMKQYSKSTGLEALDSIAENLRAAWGASKTHLATFPILLRMGRKKGRNSSDR